jgi:hypothetical protein
MRRPSTIDKQPAAIRDAVGKLQDGGATIDEIVAHLATLDVAVSRSAVHRHVQKLAAVGDRMRQSRAVAEGLVRQLGDAPESKAARLNIELAHSAIFELMTKAEDASGIEDPQAAMFLARSIESLTKASRHDVAFIEEVEKRAAARAQKAAAAAVDVVAKQRGIAADTLAAIKAGIFGVKA